MDCMSSWLQISVSGVVTMFCVLQACSQTGFHTHPATATGQKIYELCGHVYVNPRVKHQVIDLRAR